MFRLTSPNLPLFTKRPKLAPAFTLWHGNNHGTGPILRLNCYGNWQENPGWELETVLLGVTTAIGKYYRLDFAYQIQQIPLWSKVENAIASSPHTFWQSETAIHLYQSSSLPTSAIVSIIISAPVAVANNYTIRGSVTEAVTRGKVMKKVPNLIAELELYPV